MGIGQGDMLVTPLQVVDFIAAIGNGGILYRPQIIESVTDIEGNIIESFAPQVRGTLPVSNDTLEALQTGMRMVVQDPKGTAYKAFWGMQTPVFGKTGTATTSVEDPHAWFAGYTALGSTEKPDIAIAVIAENSGDGSVYAAPIFRRVVEVYFTGEIKTIYPWEYDYYLTKTPSPTETPTP
jgi:penicillin-binding protein 2